MLEFRQMYNRHLKYFLYLLSLLFLGWGFSPFKSIFLGLALGVTVSLLNHWLLVKRMKRFNDAIAKGKKIRTMGTLSRMAIAVLAVFIAVSYPGQFHFFSVIIGLMTSYIVIMIDFIIQAIIQSRKEREER